MVSLNSCSNLISKYVAEPSEEVENIKLSNDYSIVVRRIGDKNSWNITHAVVTETLTGRVALDVYHRYSKFPYVFFERDGTSYLLCCPESYQNLVIVNLNLEKVYPIDTKSWCFVGGYISPDSKRISAFGCYWGAEYDTRIYNIEDLNIPILELQETLGNDSSDEKWLDNDTFYYKFVAFVGKDGKSQDCTEWESHVTIKDPSEPNGFRIEEVKGNKTFNEAGEWTQEFLDNFGSEKIIKVGNGVTGEKGK